MIRKLFPWIHQILFRLQFIFHAFTLPLWSLSSVYIAIILGYNELAKQQDKIGQRAICRAMRSATMLAAKSIGILEEPVRFHGNPIILKIECPGGLVPDLEFRESDYELMRKALAEHDARLLTGEETSR